jgi:hypothetical protein
MIDPRYYAEADLGTQITLHSIEQAKRHAVKRRVLVDGRIAVGPGIQLAVLRAMSDEEHSRWVFDVFTLTFQRDYLD